MKTATAFILTFALLASAPAFAKASTFAKATVDKTAAGRLTAQGTNVTGEWAFNVTTDQGSGTPTITFKQEGEKLTGKYVGQLGSSDLTGTVKGNEITFSFTVDVQGQQAPVTYKGIVDKNTMKGSLDIAGMVNGTFTATKK